MVTVPFRGNSKDMSVAGGIGAVLPTVTDPRPAVWIVPRKNDPRLNRMGTGGTQCVQRLRSAESASFS
jgi:hypothetical protein